VGSLLLIVLQSLCTAVMALSGLRVLIGVVALTAAAGLDKVAGGFHTDVIRIPMMVLALGGAAVNLFIVARVRRLRARPESQWRAQAVSAKQVRAETIQIVLAVLTVLLVIAEFWTHRILHAV